VTRPVDEALFEEALVSWVASWDRCAPRDLACLVRRCGACDARFVAGFSFDHSPYRGQAGTPVYRTLEEMLAAAESLTRRREPSIPEGEWERATRCACGAPGHVVETTGARLARAVVGEAAALVAGWDRDLGASLWRVPRGGLPRRLEPDVAAAREAFGRAATWFDAWPTEPAEGLRPVAIEPGVTLLDRKSVV
jgi:hypothetical protein